MSPNILFALFITKFYIFYVCTQLKKQFFNYSSLNIVLFEAQYTIIRDNKTMHKMGQQNHAQDQCQMYTILC